jgi:glycosyltransferase EpsH
MKNEPLISVIIPCYNAQEYLVQCVESVQKQSYHNLKIILVDDGSTDKTAQMCDELAQGDARIVVFHKKNGGASQARNSGLELAQGEYIMFLDSDDWVDKETCEKALESALATNVDIVIWSYVREFSNRRKTKFVLGNEPCYFAEDAVRLLHRRIIGLSEGELSNPEHADSLVPVWGKLYRREIIKNIKFLDMSEIGTEDVYFNILAFGKAKYAYYIPECFNHYRKTNVQSLSTVYTYKIFERWKNLYRKIDEYIVDNHLDNSYQKARCNRTSFGLIGLGTNLEECSEGIRHKFRELSLVLNDPVYVSAVSCLEFKYLPMKWKVFFFFAKHRNIPCLYAMLCVINLLRRR